MRNQYQVDWKIQNQQERMEWTAKSPKFLNQSNLILEEIVIQRIDINLKELIQTLKAQIGLTQLEEKSAQI